MSESRFICFYCKKAMDSWVEFEGKRCHKGCVPGELSLGSTAYDKFTKGYELILSGIHDLGYSVSGQNFLGTPARAAKGLLQLIVNQQTLTATLEDIKRATFEVSHDDLIAVYGIRSSGICPHHLLPVLYSISVGYVPTETDSKIVGLSKLPRLVKILSKRPACQEELVNLICDFLYGDKSLIKTAGCAVSSHAIHTCMRCRGVEDQTSITVINSVRGIFRDNKTDVRNEFLRLAEKVTIV